MEEMTGTTPVVTESANEGITDNQTQEVVAEPAKTSDTGNQEGQVTGTEQVEEVSTEPHPYSYEELQNVKTYTELDPSRLPKALADAVNASKASQGELTKLQQRLAAQEKTKPQSQRPADPKQAFAYDLFQAFDQGDDYTVDRMINSIRSSIERRSIELAKLQYLDPDKAAQLEQEMLFDINHRDRIESAIAKARYEKSVNASVNNDVDTELLKEIPNFKEIAPEMGNFARKELHLDNEMIEATMSPRVIAAGLAAIYGIPVQEASRIAKKSSIGFTRALNIAYMRISGKGLQGKTNRIPPNMETGGGGNTRNSNTNLKSLHDKAMKTHDMEDLAAYYSAEATEKEKTKLRR